MFLGAAAMAFYLTPNTSTPVLGPLSGYLVPIQVGKKTGLSNLNFIGAGR